MMGTLWKNRRKGFVLLEVMVVAMVLLICTSVLFSSVEMDNRIAADNIREKEAYYAALSAVRLMASGAACNGDGWINEMPETEMELVFEPEAAGCEVSIPVTVWTRGNENWLVLYAAVKSGGSAEVVSLALTKGEAASDSNAAESGRWIPAFYGFGLEDEE